LEDSDVANSPLPFCIQQVLHIYVHNLRHAVVLDMWLEIVSWYDSDI